MSAAAADPAALQDMAAAAAAAAERRAAAAASPPSTSRYSRRPTLARHELPLDLLLLSPPSPSNGGDGARRHCEASRASCARARRDAFVAPWREAALLLQGAAVPLAVFAYGVAQGDAFCRGELDRYWTHVPRVRLPQLRARGQFGVLAGGRGVFMREVDDVLRATTRWLGRTPPHLRSKPKGVPGGPTPPVPPPKDW